YPSYIRIDLQALTPSAFRVLTNRFEAFAALKLVGMIRFASDGGSRNGSGFAIEGRLWPERFITSSSSSTGTTDEDGDDSEGEEDLCATYLIGLAKRRDASDFSPSSNDRDQPGSGDSSSEDDTTSETKPQKSTKSAAAASAFAQLLADFERTSFHPSAWPDRRDTMFVDVRMVGRKAVAGLQFAFEERRRQRTRMRLARFDGAYQQQGADFVHDGADLFPDVCTTGSKPPQTHPPHSNRTDGSAGVRQAEHASKKLRSSQDVFNRILWDPDRFDPADFTVGYEDRFRGILEIGFMDFAERKG
ncbi:hypothetical protein HK102_012725, partial [Quaeritorhiza haematococci]